MMSVESDWFNPDFRAAVRAWDLEATMSHARFRLQQHMLREAETFKDRPSMC